MLNVCMDINSHPLKARVSSQSSVLEWWLIYCQFADNTTFFDKNTGWLSKNEDCQVNLTKYFFNTYKDADSISGLTWIPFITTCYLKHTRFWASMIEWYLLIRYESKIRKNQTTLGFIQKRQNHQYGLWICKADKGFTRNDSARWRFSFVKVQNNNYFSTKSIIWNKSFLAIYKSYQA